MRLPRQIIGAFRGLVQKDRVERELDAELRDFLETAIEHKMRAGISRESATRAARLELGGAEAVKDRVRDVSWESLVETVWRDICYAWRSFTKNPGFTAVAVLTIALGVGANTAIFSVVHAVLLNPLPYQDADRLVRLVMNVPAAESPTKRPLRASLGLSAAEMTELQSHTRTLSHVGTAGPILRGLSGQEEAARLQGSRVSSTVFQMLGAGPLLGRTFGTDDETPGAEGVILLSYGAWRRFFSADPRILDRIVTLDSVLGPRTQFHHAVIGVMPQSFEFPNRQTEFWVPFQGTAPGGGPAVRGPMVARLADGTSIQEAAAEVSALLHEIRRQAPGTRYELVREQDELVAPVKPALLVLMVAVGFVLLIACVNVANLLLARTAARRREIAIRFAIGASRARLVRQMLTESVLLALVGGVAGTGLARGGIQLFRAFATTLSRPDLSPGLAFPRLEEIGVDASVLAFTTGACLVSGVLCGLAPALGRSRSDPMEALRDSGDSCGSGSGFIPRFGVRDVLVVAEIGMATVLLVGGGLLMRSFVKLSSVDPGYRPANVLTFQASLPLDHYPDSRLRSFAEELVERLRSVPGVHAAAYANQLPMVNLTDTGGGLWRTPDATRGPFPTGLDARFISRDYLDVMGIRVIAGRGFGQNDREGQTRVLLVNQALARRDFDGENPIGQSVYIGHDVAPWQIVGIVDNVRQFALDREPEPQIFADLRQWSGSPPFPVGAYYLVRTDGNPMDVVPNVRGIVRKLEANAALFNIAPMEQIVDATISRPRLYAALLTIFAGGGLTLALIGIYGVLAYFVAQRTREIGIRISLGATRGDVMGLVLRQSLVLTAFGLGLGLSGAAGLSRYLEGMLFGLTPLDRGTFLAVCALFALVATLASYVPARRATKIDPLVALRCE